jgi:hypothetical protein
MPGFSFLPATIAPWPGRFSGQASLRHFFLLKNNGKEWWPYAVMEKGKALSFCPFHPPSSLGARLLAEGIRQATARMELKPDLEPRFLVNEFGQVLVAGAPGQVMLAGEAEGPLVFQDPESVALMDLEGDESLSGGDPWLLPLAGCPYELSRKSRVYFQDPAGSQLYPEEQDWELVDALRDLMPNGPARFVVNPRGVVVLEMKKKGAETDWVYVRRVRKEYWFEKEEGG